MLEVHKVTACFDQAELTRLLMSKRSHFCSQEDITLTISSGTMIKESF
jgi:hypothetical protein